MLFSNCVDSTSFGDQAEMRIIKCEDVISSERLSGET